MIANVPTPASIDRLLQRAVAFVDSTPQSDPERRCVPRLACSIEVRGSHDGSAFMARTRDLSSTGAALEMDLEIELGEIVEVEFDLPDGPSLACVGLVRWRLEDGIGIEFHKLTPNERRSLASWLREWLAMEAGEAHRRWAGRTDVGDAFFDEAGRRLRWHIPFVSSWHEVALDLSVDRTMFVPTRGASAREGDRITVELVPPDCHVVLQLVAEVTWVARDGLGLRHAGLTAVDRMVLEAVSQHFEREAARYV